MREEHDGKKNDTITASSSFSKTDRFFTKSWWIYLSSVFLSIACAFVALKIWINHYERNVQSVSDRCDSLENRIKIITDSVSEICDKIETISSELKSNKSNSSYIYTSIASLQKDVESIKNETNIGNNHDDEASKTLSPEKKEFIEAFENLIRDGAPFEAFLTTHAEKIDMKKYATSSEIIPFSEMSVKSAQSLKKAFTSVSMSVFNTVVEESFWEKKKRLIKEKILDAFKLWKTDEQNESTRLWPDDDDKSLFTAAHEASKEGNFEKAFELLAKIDVQNKEFNELKLDIKKRSDLEKAFQHFKLEFIEAENKDILIQNKPSAMD
ncbi:MAG: hypothetical protein LBI20_03020 [Holosporales bacterium]|jgi:hypothetical protein|nr:hypothetical protein [Holosporales bacterium]